MTKKTKVGLIGVASIAVAVVITISFFGYQLFKKPVSDDGPEILFDVYPGATLNQISNSLQEKKLIRNAKSFSLYVKAKGQANKLKVGEYALRSSMTPDEIVSMIIAGKTVKRNFTVTEGQNIYDIAESIERQGIGTKEEFFKLVNDKLFIKSLLGEELTSLEGFLFPETYKVGKFDGVKVVVTQMVTMFLKTWKELEPELSKTNWSRKQVVTFASIVEKETGAKFERPLVSSVFHNRLARKMRLQTDPTILYGMAVKTGVFPKNITKNDLLTPTPYNTYTISGLPPGPISNPGKDALLATLNPAPTNYLFFVSKNDGTHVFSENLQQHNKAVQQFQMNAKARENKSWRDLNQKENN